MPLIKITKPLGYDIPEGQESSVALLKAVQMVATPAIGMAVVLIDHEGNYHTYQYGCWSQTMFQCATALTEWAQQMRKEEE
jgi:hypothetical protein